MRYATIICFILLVACSKKVVTNTVTKVTDSTIIKETVRFDTVTIQGDTVRLTEFIECDSVTNKPKPFKQRKKIGRATLSVSVSASGELETTAVCDSLQKILVSKDKEISRLRLEKTAITKILQPSKFQIWFDTTCKILAGILVVLVGLKVAKIL